jgi:hypothetical protein
MRKLNLLCMVIVMLATASFAKHRAPHILDAIDMDQLRVQPDPGHLRSLALELLQLCLLCRDAAIAISASPNVLNHSGEWIQVRWSGVAAPAPTDWIGIFTPGSHAPNFPPPSNVPSTRMKEVWRRARAQSNLLVVPRGPSALRSQSVKTIDSSSGVRYKPIKFLWCSQSQTHSRTGRYEKEHTHVFADCFC